MEAVHGEFSRQLLEAGGSGSSLRAWWFSCAFPVWPQGRFRDGKLVPRGGSGGRDVSRVVWRWMDLILEALKFLKVLLDF